MSDFDEIDYEEMNRELAESLDPNNEELQPEDILSLVMINKIKGTKIHVTLEDEDGDEVNLPETITQLLNYVKDKIQDTEGNQFTDQIVPLMSQSVVSGLGRMIGINQTAFHLSNPVTRTSIIYMMSIGLLLLKFVQENNLKIYTHEKEVPPEEIEDIERKTKANSMAIMSSATGIDPREVLQKFVDQGEISMDDLRDIMKGKKDDDGEDT